MQGEDSFRPRGVCSLEEALRQVSSCGAVCKSQQNAVEERGRQGKTGKMEGLGGQGPQVADVPLVCLGASREVTVAGEAWRQIEDI